MMQNVLTGAENTLQATEMLAKEAQSQCSLSVCSHHHPTLAKPPYMGVYSIAEPPHIVVSVVSVVSVV